MSIYSNGYNSVWAEFIITLNKYILKIKNVYKYILLQGSEIIFYVKENSPENNDQDESKEDSNQVEGGTEQTVNGIDQGSSRQKPPSLRAVVQAKFIRRGWRKMSAGRIEDTPTGWRLVR